MQATSLKQRIKELCTLEYFAKYFLLLCFFFCYSVDISLYSSFALSTPAMLSDKLYLGTNFNKETLGIMNSVATAFGFFGKLILPFFVDHLGGVTTSLTVTFLMSIGVFTFGYTSYVLSVTSLPSSNGGVFVHVFLTAIYAIDRFIDAAAWSSLTLIIRTWFPSFTWGTMFVDSNINTYLFLSNSFGIASTYSRLARVVIGFPLTALIEKHWSWLFMVSGVYGLGIFLFTFFSYIFWFCILSQVHKYHLSKQDQIEYKPLVQHDEEEENDQSLVSQADIGIPELAYATDNDEVNESNGGNDEAQQNEANTAAVAVDGEEEPFQEESTKQVPASENALDAKTTCGAIWYIVTSPIFWIVCGMQCTYYAIFDLPVYIPVYLFENKNLSPADAGRASLAFSLGPVITVLASGFIYDVIARFKFGRFLFIALNQIIVVICAFAVWILPTLNTTVTMILLFFVAACASPGYYITYSIFSAHFGGKKHTAKVGSFVSAVANLFSIAFSYSMGIVTQKLGWSVFWLIMMIICVASAVLAAIYEIYAMIKFKFKAH